MRKRFLWLLTLVPCLGVLPSCRERSSRPADAGPDSTVEVSPLVGNRPESERFGSDSVRWAEFRLRGVETNILRFHDAYRRFPDSLAEAVPIPPGLPTKRSYQYDPWGTLVRYAHTDSTFELRSAGPDRVFETRDDLSLAWTVREGRERNSPTP